MYRNANKKANALWRCVQLEQTHLHSPGVDARLTSPYEPPHNSLKGEGETRVKTAYTGPNDQHKVASIHHDINDIYTQ